MQHLYRYARALFPAQVQHVEKAAEDKPDEWGQSRRLDKYIAYVNTYEQAKAIGAVGTPYKLNPVET
jgi:transcription antitermination factor NusA-like protein